MVALFKAGRRKKYRVEMPSSGVVEVGLVFSRQKVVPGDPVNLNLDGSALIFPAHQCPDLTPNEKVKLQFVMTQTKKRILINAMVKDTCTAGKRRLCRFQFAEPDRLLQELGPSLYDYFNRREDLRIKPDESEPIQVLLEWHSGFAQGRIIDVSTTGIGL